MRDLLNSWKATLILGITILFVIGLIWWFVFERPARLADEVAKQAAIEYIQKGDAESAEKAIAEISDLNTRQELREELERESANAIQDDTPISNDTYLSTMRELCKSASYRNDAECVEMRKLDSQQPSR